MQGDSNDDVSSPSSPLRAIAASALQKFKERSTRFGSWVPGMGKARNVPKAGDDDDMGPLPSTFDSLSLPTPLVERGAVSAQNTTVDFTRGSPEPHASEEAQSNPSNLLTEILLSQSNYRFDESQIKFIEGPQSYKGYADVVPANILNNPDFAGVVLAVKRFCFREYTNDDRVIALFTNELRFQSKLKHENILRLVGFVENRSSRIAWLVLPWMANGNVREFLKSRLCEASERISLLYDVACGVEYLHSQNPPIRHGDLKSLNIVVNSEHRALITDFLCARSSDTSPWLETLTGTMGTVLWMAPEVLLEDLLVLAGDIWSFGWLCWEIITDKVPFEGEGAKESQIVLRIVQHDLPSLKDVSRFSLISPLRTLIENCWRTDPEERPSAGVAWIRFPNCLVSFQGTKKCSRVIQSPL